MFYLYEVEEQADRTGVVVAHDADWCEHFTPVAPVQPFVPCRPRSADRTGRGYS